MTMTRVLQEFIISIEKDLTKPQHLPPCCASLQTNFQCLLLESTMAFGTSLFNFFRREAVYQTTSKSLEPLIRNIRTSDICFYFSLKNKNKINKPECKDVPDWLKTTLAISLSAVWYMYFENLWFCFSFSCYTLPLLTLLFAAAVILLLHNGVYSSAKCILNFGCQGFP